MTKKKTGKRGRPVKSISDRYDEQEINVDTLIRGFEPKWFAANQGNFLNPAGRKKLLMEVKRLREEAKKKKYAAKLYSHKGNKFNQCVVKILQSGSELQDDRAKLIELLSELCEGSYPVIRGEWVLQLLLKDAVRVKNKYPKNWREEFMLILPFLYLSLIKTEEIDREEVADNNSAARSGSKNEKEFGLPDLKSKPLPSNYSKSTFPEAISQFLKDYAGWTYHSRTIERRLAELGLTDTK